MRRLVVSGIILSLLFAYFAQPTLACEFNSVHTAYSYLDIVKGHSDATSGSSSQVWASGETIYYGLPDPSEEVGLRLTGYKYYEDHLYWTGEVIEPEAGPGWGVDDSGWMSTSQLGCWHVHGYHWAEGPGSATYSCGTLSVYHTDDESLMSGTLSHSCTTESQSLFGSLSYAVDFADRISRPMGEWAVIAYEDLAGMKGCLGIGAGTQLAHFLYITGADAFDLRPGDLMPVVYIAADRMEAAVGMFTPASATAVIVRLGLDETGEWAVLGQTEYEWQN